MCREYIIIKGKNFPFYQQSEFGNCKYAVTATDSAEMASILEEAKGMSGYMNHSRPFVIPQGILVFVIFKAE